MDTLVPLTPFQRIWSIRLEESKIFTRVLDNICLIPLFQELMFFVLPFPDYKVKVKLLSHVRLFVKRDKDGHYIMIKGSIQEDDITIINIYMRPT